MNIKDFITCIWLFIPIFTWNAILYKRLPGNYQNEKWDNIPKWIIIIENILRISVFLIPVLLRIKIDNETEILGIIIYMFGLLIYFSSWIMQIIWRNSQWSNSLAGFTAPAYTTIIFLIGVVLIGQENILNIKGLQNIYLMFVIAFAIIHTLHSFIVYSNEKNK